MFTNIISFLSGLTGYILNTLYYDGFYLFISIFIAVLLSVFIKPEKAKALFLRRPQWMIPGSVTIGAVTPLCACGTMAVVLLFIIFVAIAYLLKTYIPDAWVMSLFSGDHFYAVPLASLIGLPLYISDATVVPLLSVLREAGASDGTLLAFMISGPATSLGVIGGLNIIMKRKAILLYVFFILSGSIILGYGYDALLRLL